MRAKTPRKQMRRQDDRTRVAKDKLAAMPRGTWKAVRDRYPAKVREFVDMVATNGVTFSDLMCLTAARYKAIELLWDEAMAEREEARQKNGGSLPNGSTAPGKDTPATYDHAMRQSLGAMHALAKDMGPQGGIGDVAVRPPEGYDLEAVRKRKAERTAAKREAGKSRNEILN